MYSASAVMAVKCLTYSTPIAACAFVSVGKEVWMSRSQGLTPPIKAHSVHTLLKWI